MLSVVLCVCDLIRLLVRRPLQAVCRSAHRPAATMTRWTNV